MTASLQQAFSLAIGINVNGIKEVLGMWTSENEDAKFWLQVVTELMNRGVKEIFIACVDGLKVTWSLFTKRYSSCSI